MLRPNADPENLQPTDFLCNFCGRSWSDDNPMIEGHQGNLICAKCLTVAYSEVVLGGAGAVAAPVDDDDDTDSPDGAPGTGGGERPMCVMCLERRKEASWQCPIHEDQRACRRCVRQAGAALSKDPDAHWTRPTA